MYKQAVLSEHKKINFIFSKSSMKFYLNLLKVTLKLFIPIFHFLDSSQIYVYKQAVFSEHKEIILIFS